jgi:hypothetical protein
VELFLVVAAGVLERVDFFEFEVERGEQVVSANGDAVVSVVRVRLVARVERRDLLIASLEDFDGGERVECVVEEGGCGPEVVSGRLVEHAHERGWRAGRDKCLGGWRGRVRAVCLYECCVVSGAEQ